MVFDLIFSDWGDFKHPKKEIVFLYLGSNQPFMGRR